MTDLTERNDNAYEECDAEHGELSKIEAQRYCSDCDMWIGTANWKTHNCIMNYDFIDPDQPKRKREVQRRIEVLESHTNEEKKPEFSLEDYPEVRNRSLAITNDTDIDAEEITRELEEIEEVEEEVNTDKVAGENGGIVYKLIESVRGLFK